MRFDVHHHLPPALLEALAGISRSIHSIDQRLSTMNQGMQDMTDAVTKMRGVAESAVVLVNGIADRIANAGIDPVALRQLTQSLNAEADTLGKAVAANQPTPADPGTGGTTDPGTGAVGGDTGSGTGVGESAGTGVASTGLG